MQARESVNAVQKSPADWRLKLGLTIFALSILLPVVAVPLIASLGLSTALSASISGGMGRLKW